MKIRAVAFDVFQTLFSFEPLRPRVVALGLPPDALELWFAHTLRDGFALAAADAYQPFQAVAREALESLLAAKGKPIDPSAVDATMAGFGELTAHADVGPALTAVRQRQVPAYALSNGSRESTLHLLRQAKLEAYFAGVISIDDVQLWKPRREVYLHAAKVAAVEPATLALVAAHAWDVHGARAAGCVGAFVPRTEPRFPASLGAPDVTGATLVDVCDQLLA